MTATLETPAALENQIVAKTQFMFCEGWLSDFAVAFRKWKFPVT
jgi:hypothetical protein